MKFHVISIFPELVLQTLQWGVIGRALQKQIFSVETINPRTYTHNVHKTVDDTPFGGGDGMIMMYEPLAQSIEAVPHFDQMPKIFMSPTGIPLTESLVKKWSSEKEMIILSGRYGGVDQRVLHKYNFTSISVGDYVVSGGELPAGLLIDAIVRKLPGVLGNTESPAADSFANNGLFEAPAFTKPRENVGGLVPDILLSGDHKKIAEFRENIGLALTLQWRPDLVKNISEHDKKKLKKYLLTLDTSTLQLMGIQSEFVEGLS